jgi:hypothetical protein
MDGSADILQLAMFGPLQVDRSATSQASSAEAEWKRELLPRQSSTVHNGISLDDSCGEVASVTYAMFHPQASRCDQVRSLTAAEVASKGANGGTLAQHLMLEIAFLLGHMPKYGRYLFPPQQESPSMPFPLVGRCWAPLECTAVTIPHRD